MSGVIPSGKVPAELLGRLFTQLPRSDPGVRLGPAVGEDASAIELPVGALVVATDPITLTASDVGSYAVAINANDVAVMGMRPRWFLATVLLPEGATSDDVEGVFADMGRALEALGASLVGGHTEVTDAVRAPVVVGQMLGYASDGRFVSTSGAGPGDVLVQAGPVPVEGAAVLASESGDGLGGVDPGLLELARRAIEDPGISVVDAALTAAELGATAMHDPTEGGLASGVHELAVAAGVGVSIDRDRVLWFEPGVAVCQALGADPWATIASGSVLATFAPEHADAAVDELGARGHPAARIGTIEGGEGVRGLDGEPIPWPARDEVARVLGG